MANSTKPVVFWIEDKLRDEMNVVMEYLEGTQKYDLRYADTVVEAREALDRWQGEIDLVLLDVILPIGTETIQSVEEMVTAGITLYHERIKQLKVPVVVLSCRDDEAAVDAFKTEDICGQMFKPVFPDDVEAAIDAALAEKG